MPKLSPRHSRRHLFPAVEFAMATVIIPTVTPLSPPVIATCPHFCHRLIVFHRPRHPNPGRHFPGRAVVPCRPPSSRSHPCIVVSLRPLRHLSHPPQPLAVTVITSHHRPPPSTSAATEYGYSRNNCWRTHHRHHHPIHSILSMMGGLDPWYPMPVSRGGET